VIPEVGLFFNNQLFRGNRTSKVNAIEFDAFESPNLCPLVKMGIKSEVSWSKIWRPTEIAPFNVHKIIDSSVVTFRIFPGISESTLGAFLSVPEITGVVLETFGSGNAPNNRPELLNILKNACDKGIVIVNISQCKKGLVSDLYATGRALADIGIVPGSDMTSECALAKLAYLLGKYPNQPAKVRELMRTNMRGELTILEVKQQFTYFISHGFASSIKILLKTNDSEEIEGENESAALEKSLVPMVKWEC
jgi:lysophospholipase